MKSENWVDFKAIKDAVSFDKVLAHCEINGLQKSGDELVGRCPIHQGDGLRAFHVSLKKNVFNCFSCKARGNVLDFVAAMEKCSVRDAAIKLQSWFAVVALEEGTRQEKKTEPAPVIAGAKADVMVNKPLTFQLKGIDHAHSYLAGRGISRETAEEFGIGHFGRKGSMSGRVVIPIHNERGELVAYAGRAVDDSEPKYKVPVGFHKSQVLFNLHRVTANEVIIVEGFFDCIKIWQSLHPFVVALMGCSLSEHQERLLLRQFKKVTLLLDGDSAGRQTAEAMAARLVRKMHVRIVDLAVGQQPDGMTAEELDSLLK